jgi:cytoskeletal protein RodZ
VPEVGNSLREARIRRGLSIKDVEDVTKIRSKYLEALEEDDFEVLPGPTYVKGFLRTYATFLKLNADALVDQYRSQYEPRNDDPAVLRADLTRSPRSRSGSASSGSGKSRRSLAGPQLKPKRTRRNQRGYILVGVVAVIVVVLLAWFGSGRGQPAASIGPDNISSSTASTSPGAAVVSTTIPVGTGDSSGSSTTATTGGATGATSAGNVTLVVDVTQGSCWLVVREDSAGGAEIYAGTLSAGGQQTFDSSKRYWMLVGKPEVLALSVNGAAYSLTEPAGSFLVTGAGIERSQ